MGLTPDELAAWVTASCVRHDVPVKVADSLVIGQVVALLTGKGEGGPGGPAKRRRDPAPSPSDSPDRVDPVRIEAGPGLGSRLDDGVVEEGGHDGVLAPQVQLRPPAA